MLGKGYRVKGVSARKERRGKSRGERSCKEVWSKKRERRGITVQ